MDTVTLTIDGRQVRVAKGTTVLEAAIESGISLPYYCYHPGLGVDGSCRVCIVKIEKMPKLQTSCSTVCTDGMAVSTRTREVVEAREGVFEFLLVNHPLDCPVCDKGGECPLQDFSYAFGRDQSRMEFERRVFDGDGAKGDVEFGPTLMLNRQRCILCTRCVRFMRDVDGDAQINIINRGYGSEIATFQEEGVRSILSGNLMDVCPVGAITTRDYRFKSRPWDNLHAADTICTLCSKGCGTTAWIKAKPEWAKGSRLIRFTPRSNPDVNGYWMCDIGRFEYHWIEGGDRARQPLERAAYGSDASAQQPVTWTEVMGKLCGRLAAAAASNPEGVRFLVSAHASHEELFLIRRLTEELIDEREGGPSEAPEGSPAPPGRRASASGGGAPRAVMSADGPSEAPEGSPAPPGRRASASGGGAPRAVMNAASAVTVTWRYREKPQPEHTKFKVPPVDAPNVNGARVFGLAGGSVGDPVGEPDSSRLRQAVEAGRVTALYVLDPGPDGSLGDTRWIVEARRRGALPLLIVQGVLMTELAREADFVLPGASYVEKEASYTNDQGRLQGTARAIAPPGDAMEDWRILVNVAAGLGAAFEYAAAARVRADIAARYPGARGLEGLTTLAFGGPINAGHWLQTSNPSERWKWDSMFRDLPPVKFDGEPFSTNFGGVIALREAK